MLLTYLSISSEGVVFVSGSRRVQARICDGSQPNTATHASPAARLSISPETVHRDTYGHARAASIDAVSKSASGDEAAIEVIYAADNVGVRASSSPGHCPGFAASAHSGDDASIEAV